MCLNLERMMDMFSKELAELDKNTVQYMIDEMQDTIDAQNTTIDAQNLELQNLKREIEELKKQLKSEDSSSDDM